MQFSESWLRQYVNPALDSEALGHAMTMAGLEVEEQYPVAPPFTQVVVAEILSAEQHPDADRLRVCKVNAGTGSELQIVCGAPNARAGIKIPCALVGALLPPAEVGGKPFQIKVGKLRGVESQGMLCSGRELGLGEDHEGILELPLDAPVGSDIREYLGLDDQIYIIKLTPNKADCLSLTGLAREVSAITGAALCGPTWKAPVASINDRLPVHIDAPDLCGRFAGRVIRGVNPKAKTPDWIVQRLRHAGQRSISPLVDLSNYVMLEMGQPTHVFDLDQLRGDLHVRWAKPGEQIALLNEQVLNPIVQGELTNQLAQGVGVVADSTGPVSLAGIMGGNTTAVSDNTVNIYVEAAFWWPDAIAGRTRKLKLNSEAAHRFERGVDFESIPQDINALVSLIVDICGGQAGPVQDLIVNLPKREPVDMRLSRCQRVLGIPVLSETVEDVLTRLGLYFQKTGDIFTVTPPAYRFDIEIEADLIEEVARIIGFDSIPANPPLAPAKMRAQPEGQRSVHNIRHQVAALDYQEVVNFAFVQTEWERDMIGASNPIELLNPIASQMAVMRSMLIPGLLQTVVYNANRQQSRVRVFEAGRVFIRNPNQLASGVDVMGVSQPMHVAGVAWGSVAPEQWGLKSQAVDFYDVKRDLEVLLGDKLAETSFDTVPSHLFHPGRSAELKLSGQSIGWLGEIHPKWVRALGLSSAPVAFEIALSALTYQSLPEPVDVSKQPIVQRDLALWVSQDVPVQQLLNAMKALIKKEVSLSVVRRVELFDVWRPADQNESKEISLAFRFWLQDENATLSDEQVDRCLTQIRTMLETDHQARQR